MKLPRRGSQLTGVIGGSGVYDVEGLANTQWIAVPSPFGAPSDDLLYGELDGVPIVFLPRHGRGHRIPPSEINFRANIDAMKRVGVTDVISLSAVGSLREDLAPGTFVVVDQFIDRTFARQKSFFESGLVAHVPMADPVCNRLRSHLMDSAGAISTKAVDGGTYVVIEGPQFSTRAESELYRQWGCDVIGMTNMPEAKLAREAELCYASVAMVTDFDCWHPDHDDVTVDAIVKVLLANAADARRMVKQLTPRLNEDPDSPGCSCRSALEHAIITAPGSRDSKVAERLDAVAGRVLGSR